MEEESGVRTVDPMETSAAAAQESKDPSLPPKSARLNRYALACAVLASTNSILLGYGKSNFILFIHAFLDVNL